MAAEGKSVDEECSSPPADNNYDMRRLDAYSFDEAEATAEAQAAISMHEADKNGAIDKSAVDD